MKAAERLKIAGRELAQGNFGNAVKSFYAPANELLLSAEYRGTGSSGGWLFGMGGGGTDVHFSFSSLTDAMQAYNYCPPVAAIINRKTQAHINGKTTIVNTQGKAGGKEATGEIANKLRKLLTKPNPMQNWYQFEAQLKVYLQLFGYCPILPIKPFGFDLVEATALWIVPPYLLNITESDSLFYKTGNPIQSVELTYRGQTVHMKPDDILFVRDFTPSFYSMAIPQSRIKALAYPINNIIGAYESRNVLINRRGALGILSNAGKDSISTIPLNPEDKIQVQNDLMRYGLKNQQWQVIVTNAALQWQQMGYPTKELMLFEEVDSATMSICDGLGYPYRLLSSEKSASFNDVMEFKKMLYNDHIIPEALDIYEQLSSQFGLEKYNLKICKDYSHVPALQEDEYRKNQATLSLNRALEIRFKYNTITINEWRDENDQEPIPEGNKYFSDIRDLIVVNSQPAGTQNSDNGQQDTTGSTDNAANNGASGQM